MRDHGIELDTDKQLGLLGIEREIISIYTNLIENAIKYSPEGSLITIIWNKDPEGQACLTVKDNGAGFTPEHIPLLTQRFYRVSDASSSQEEGTGLGLAIVKHAVIRHGGSLTINSEPGTGAEFRVCFTKTRAIKLRQ